MLDHGATFPTIQARDLEGEPTTINSLIEGSWAVVLIYRGHW